MDPTTMTAMSQNMIDCDRRRCDRERRFRTTTRAASSAESKVPNQSLVFFHGFLITAVNLPHTLFYSAKPNLLCGASRYKSVGVAAPVDGSITVLVATVALALRMARENGSVADLWRGRRGDTYVRWWGKLVVLPCSGVIPK
ncbi:hypothetical protein U1Q18_015795 [Sarracenia purpurea var. burkii]